MPLWQSAGSAQPWPLPQASQSVPPQSISVSPLLLRPSVQEGAMHWPPLHRSLWQSALATQALPVAQGPQEVPPQSTSVSSPFCALSLQLGVVMVSHCPATQACPSGQVPSGMSLLQVGVPSLGSWILTVPALQAASVSAAKRGKSVCERRRVVRMSEGLIELSSSVAFGDWGVTPCCTIWLWGMPNRQQPKFPDFWGNGTAPQKK